MKTNLGTLEKVLIGTAIFALVATMTALVVVRTQPPAQPDRVVLTVVSEISQGIVFRQEGFLVKKTIADGELTLTIKTEGGQQGTVSIPMTSQYILQTVEP